MTKPKHNKEEKEKTASTENEVQAPEDTRIKDLESQVETLKNQKIQLYADFDNYRKRMDAERATFGAIANMGLIKEILEIYDDIELALSDSSLNLDNAKMSLKVAQDKLSGAARSAGVEKIEVKVGDEFDKTKMEAIQTVPDENNKNKVIAVVSSAYKYVGQDTILKHAKVIVGK